MDTLKDIAVLVAILSSAWALWKSKKSFPLEQGNLDAGASKSYAEAAKLAAEQMTNALERIELLETRSNTMINKVSSLQELISQRDKCIDTLNDEIKKRDLLIEDWSKGIKILIAQLQKENIPPLWIPRDFRS